MPDRSTCAKATFVFNEALIQDKIELFSLVPKFCLQCEISIIQGKGRERLQRLERARGSVAKGLLGASRRRISARLARPRCGSGSRPRFNWFWMTSMAPAARGEPLGGSETRLKQLACCRHIVLRQGRGYRGDRTLADQATAWRGATRRLRRACGARGLQISQEVRAGRARPCSVPPPPRPRRPSVRGTPRSKPRAPTPAAS